MTHLLTPSRDLSDHTPGQHGHDALFLTLKRLPRRTQLVFLYSRLDDLPYPAIAQRLDISLAVVEKDMHRVLQTCTATHTPPQIQAIDWYIRLQSPSTTASERIDFRRWLDSDGLHLAAFHDTELHWRRLLAPAHLLGIGLWYRKARPTLGVRGWLTAGLAMALTLEFISQTL